jgi:pyruvate/2-oxoglutarate dehydrogenase complex dihydrolipoamide acyltransferase (E2) component
VSCWRGFVSSGDAMIRPPRGCVPLIVPEHGLTGVPAVVSVWLVPVGTAVLAGDRIVELVAGGATIDLEAPVAGRLAAQLADEDEPVQAGRVVAELEVGP